MIVLQFFLPIGALLIGPALWGMIDKSIREQKNDNTFPIKEVVYISLYSLAVALWLVFVV